MDKIRKFYFQETEDFNKKVARVTESNNIRKLELFRSAINDYSKNWKTLLRKYPSILACL